MKTVAQVRVACRDRLVSSMGDWAAALVGADAVLGPAADEAEAAPRSAPPTASAVGTGSTERGQLMTIALSPPTEKEMLKDERAAEEWTRAWRALTPPDGVEVDWTTRVWRSIGRQQVPVRVRVRHADGVAALAGGSARQDWLLLNQRTRVLAGRFGSTEGVARCVKRHRAALLKYGDPEFRQVVDVAAWVVANPIAGLRPRQVPVRGVDSKWLGHHRSLVRDLVRAVKGTAELGLVEADPLVRLRVLDSTLAVGGLRDIAAPPQQVSALPMAPRAVIVMENLESVLAMPDLPGAVVVHGSGFAVDAVASIPWVARVPILYWGDLDSHGFAILNRLRLHHPMVASVLMDEATLLAYRDLWVKEPTPTRAALPALTSEEAATLGRIRAEGDVRLEQERVPWAQALAAVHVAWECLAAP